MAYKAIRSRKCVESLELVNENGEVEKIIQVEITTGKLADSLSRKYVELIRAQREMKQLSNDTDKKTEKMVQTYEHNGTIVLEMMEIVFGEKNTKEIMSFYENDYVEIIQQVMPFIINIILPEVRSIAQENKAKILEQYNRKNRRSVGRGMRS